MKRIFSRIFSGKKQEEVDEKKDFERSHNDLVYDVKQKRKLNQLLLRSNSRLKLAFSITFLCLVLFAGISISSLYLNNKEKEIFNYHYNNFKQRYISSLGLVLTSPSDFTELSEIVEKNQIVIESNMLMAILAIEKKDYIKATGILEGTDNDEAVWLKALCYLRLKEKEKAKRYLTKLIDKRSLFSIDAHEILNSHYGYK